MVTITLTGRITDAGKLEVDLPNDLPSGEVTVTLEIPVDNTPLTDEEIAELTKVSPKSGAEIVANLQNSEPAFQYVEDSAAWVEEQRRKRKEASKW